VLEIRTAFFIFKCKPQLEKNVLSNIYPLKKVPILSQTIPIKREYLIRYYRIII